MCTDSSTLQMRWVGDQLGKTLVILPIRSPQLFLYLEKNSPMRARRTEASGASYPDTFLSIPIFLETEGTSGTGGDQSRPARLRPGCPRDHSHRGLQDQGAWDCVWDCVCPGAWGGQGDWGKEVKRKEAVLPLRSSQRARDRALLNMREDGEERYESRKEPSRRESASHLQVNVLGRRPLQGWGSGHTNLSPLVPGPQGLQWAIIC